MEQFQQDPSELQVLNINVDPPDFGSIEEVVEEEDLEEEEDPEEDSEEEEHSKGSNSSENFEDSDELDYLQDPKDFDP